jgi:para-aminobenzoate synthetase component 1
MVCTDLAELTDDPAALDTSGFWAVVLPYDGPPLCARFATVRPATPWRGTPWPGCRDGAWRSTLEEPGFRRGVERIREAIAAGDVYQVNLTRRLRAPIDLDRPGTDVAALGAALAVGNPAPYSAVVRIPEAGVAIASASPERYLRRDGDLVRSSPIKGTAAHRGGFLAKDRAENVMIVDLVRNDLGRVCRFGSVSVPALCAPEDHPGLVHLVSTVTGRLVPGAGWADLVGATFPPGSVTGAPKIAACRAIAELEADARGPYCGAIGWVDADRRAGELNVAIRTFWMADDHLWLGTGGGITIDSTPAGEWAETELKASRLLDVVSAPAPSKELAR